MDDPKQRRPDITRARTLLGWEPKVGLEEGLLNTVGYFKSKLADLTRRSAAVSFRAGSCLRNRGLLPISRRIRNT